MIADLKDEPLLVNSSNKYTIFPIEHQKVWEFYLTHLKAIWFTDDVDTSADLKDWTKLNNNEQYFIKHILAFFAASDGIVMENLAANFCNEIQMAEARQFYSIQMFIESIHSIMYSKLIETYVTDSNEKNDLFNAIEKFPSITKKAEWAKKWMDTSVRFAVRLVGFIIVEGLFFSGAFCSIYWLNERGLMHGLCMSNKYISRDESLHCVAPESLILTKTGYKKIIDYAMKEVEIWNGFEWSLVIPVKTGENKKLLKVKLSNGIELECTPEHKWIVVSDEKKNKQPQSYKYIKKETKDLVKGDILQKFELPIIDCKDNVKMECPYTQGIFAADGMYADKKCSLGGMPIIKFKRQDKKDLLKFIKHKSIWNNEKEDYLNITLHREKMLDKFFVPINCSINTKLRWLEGYSDGDGSLAKSQAKNSHGIKIGSINLEFLKNVQLLLSTLGCNSPIKKVYGEHQKKIKGKVCICRPLYSISITNYQTTQLRKLGFKPKRLDLGDEDTLRNAELFVKVEDIIDEGRISNTYCFTEEKNHTAVFNGIMTGNCDFAIYLYNTYIKNKLTQEEIDEVISEAVNIEKEFITESLPVSLIGMNSNMMSQYIEYVADRLINQLGYKSKFAGVKNPFPFMDRICLTNQTNFFDTRVSEYQRTDGQKNLNMNDISFGADF